MSHTNTMFNLYAPSFSSDSPIADDTNERSGYGEYAFVFEIVR